MCLTIAQGALGGLDHCMLICKVLNFSCVHGQQVANKPHYLVNQVACTAALQ